LRTSFPPLQPTTFQDENVLSVGEKFDGEDEPARPAANDDDGAIVRPAHGIPRLHDLKL